MKITKSFILIWLLSSPYLRADEATALADFRAAIDVKYTLKEAAFAAADATPIIENFYTNDVIATDTYVNGNAGWDWANFHVVPKDPQAEGFSFKILFLWERIDGEWWCKGDMYVLGAFDVAGAPQRQALNPQ